MAATTGICEFGWQAPEFELADATGKLYKLSDIKGPNGTLIMFICNHCPYVVAIAPRLAETCQKLQENGIGVAAINANDWHNYPEDAPKLMPDFANRYGFTFPYLIDETQKIARSWDAVCTPDFFGLNKDLQLQYRGRFDNSRKDIGLTTPTQNRIELLDAMLQIAKTGHGPKAQVPSIGCSIKWR